jgi:hypothetical protein
VTHLRLASSSILAALALAIVGACTGPIVIADGTAGAGGTTTLTSTTSSNPTTSSNATTSSNSTTSSSSTSSSSTSGCAVSASSSGGPVDHCAGAIHLALGSTVSGTTCGGAQYGESPCQEPGHPDVFIYVDAPQGSPIELSASPGVSLLAFPTCQSDQTSQCTFSAPVFRPDPQYLLFAVERVDTCCGEFTVGATKPCVSSCTTAGATRCTGDAIETCTQSGSCLQWAVTTPCPFAQHCSSDATRCVASTNQCSTAADCTCGCTCTAQSVCGNCTGAIPATCTQDSDCGPTCAGVRCVAGTCQPETCIPGEDQTCNDNLGMNAFAGTCNPDRTCTCKSPFTVKPSGKCG